LCEATGKGLPVVVLPYLNAAQGEHLQGRPCGPPNPGRRDRPASVGYGPDLVTVLYAPEATSCWPTVGGAGSTWIIRPYRLRAIDALVALASHAGL